MAQAVRHKNSTHSLRHHIMNITGNQNPAWVEYLKIRKSATGKRTAYLKKQDTQQGDLLSSGILEWLFLPVCNCEGIALNKAVETKWSLEVKRIYTYVQFVLLVHIYPAYSRFHTWYNCIVSIQDRLNKQQLHVKDSCKRLMKLAHKFKHSLDRLGVDHL